jgi:molecular chaperone GrpE (heat shock protein)
VNKERRKRLAEITADLSAIRDQVEEVKADEEDARTNMPEAIQGSSRGDAMQAAIESMEEGVDALESIVDSFSQLCDSA